MILPVNAVEFSVDILALVSHSRCKSTIRGARKMQSNFLNRTPGVLETGYFDLKPGEFDGLESDRRVAHHHARRIFSAVLMSYP